MDTDLEHDDLLSRAFTDIPLSSSKRNTSSGNLCAIPENQKETEDFIDIVPKLTSSSIHRDRIRTRSNSSIHTGESFRHKPYPSYSAIKQQFLLNQPSLLILEFRDDGTQEFRELRRDEILKEARTAIPYIPGQKISTHKDDTRSFYKGKSNERRFAGTLRARDIRLLDTSFSNAHDPSIVVRRHAVMINLPPIKALVTYNRCFLVVPDGADSLLAPFMEKLQRETTHDREGFESFDLRAMEAIFVTVCSQLQKDV